MSSPSGCGWEDEAEADAEADAEAEDEAEDEVVCAPGLVELLFATISLMWLCRSSARG